MTWASFLVQVLVKGPCVCRFGKGGGVDDFLICRMHDERAWLFPRFGKNLRMLGLQSSKLASSFVPRRRIWGQWPSSFCICISKKPDVI